LDGQQRERGEPKTVHDPGVRWLICLVVLAHAPGASAELVVNDPPTVRRCPRAKTWDLLTACLAKHGKATVTKQVRGAKLVTLTQKQGTREVDTGVLLYVERRGEWQIGGRFETYGNGEYQVLGLEPVTVGKKKGFRLDVRQASAFNLVVDGLTSIPAQMFTRRNLFCNGDSYHCADAISQCDVSIDGQTWYSFRGVLEYEENVVNIKGDRSRAGPYCGVQPKIYLAGRSPGRAGPSQAEPGTRSASCDRQPSTCRRRARSVSAIDGRQGRGRLNVELRRSGSGSGSGLRPGLGLVLEAP
jgi:hypothetical protein